jgi:flagellar biosynthesis protein FlhG
MDRHTTIIPIAAGKGGVGKSFVAANLAIALAREGHATIVADLDLGNSNLYSFLGLENRFPGVAEFLTGPPGRSLAEFLAPTGIPNLEFLPGDGWTPFTANITHTQKQLLLRELPKLEADYLLLDLGAGSSFKTLDFFGVSDRGLLVARPEQPAIVSVLVFLKNYVLRVIEQKLRKDPDLLDTLNQLRHQPVNGPSLTVRAFRDRIAKANPQAAAAIDAICRRIRPRLLYNMADDPGDAQFLPPVEATLRDVLSIGCDHIGFVPFDPSVSRSLKGSGGIPADRLAPAAADAFARIAARIVSYWDQDIPGSAELLARYFAREFGEPQDAAE